MAPEDHDVITRLDANFTGFLRQWEEFMKGPGAARCVEMNESVKSSHKRIDEVRQMVWAILILILGKIGFDWMGK